MDRELVATQDPCGPLPLGLPRPAGGGLRKVITLRHGVALYVSSLLGSGIQELTSTLERFEPRPGQTLDDYLEQQHRSLGA